MGSEDTAFDDVEQLGEYMTDTRSFDTRQISSPADAAIILDALAANTGSGAWPYLDRAEVGARLKDIAYDSRLIQQGALNLCGPAAFICMWAGRDPVGFAEFAVALYDSGSSWIGSSVEVAPTEEFRNTDPSTMPTGTEKADWMVLGAIRNSTELFWQPEWEGDPDQLLAGITRPEELAGWLEATGAYSSVSDEADWTSSAGLEHALGLNLAEGTDIALLIHTNMISAARHQPLDSTFLLSMFSNHFVVAVSSPVVAIADDPAGRWFAGDVLISLWSWGRDTANLDLAVPQTEFASNYFGAIIARSA